MSALGRYYHMHLVVFSALGRYYDLREAGHDKNLLSYMKGSMH